ncbi:DUF2207 family protein [Kordiimonas aestuarii]|uniref:DUF2207 family protein n=1 Tax=Kordiimonas aestuarii TaxID=1005925 RepID=UPI0021D090D2|nr:DUF2207 domain-containing protein [Kordiimonas aestuarii]
MNGAQPDDTANRYYPPKGMTPALAHVLASGDYNARSFGAALTALVARDVVSLRHEGEGYTLRRGAQKPADQTLSKGEAALVRSLFVAGDEVPVTRHGYLRLSAAMKAHYRGLKRENRLYLNGPFRLGIVAVATGFGMMAYAVAHARTPVLGSGLAETGVPAWSLIAWLVAIAALLDLWRHRRGRKPAATHDRLARYREYLRVAMADRLDPKFGPSGHMGVLTEEHAYIVAFGLENTGLDAFVHALESVSGHAPEGTSIYSAFRRGRGGKKRGWQFKDDFWGTRG